MLYTLPFLILPPVLAAALPSFNLFRRNDPCGPATQYGLNSTLNTCQQATPVFDDMQSTSDPPGTYKITCQEDNSGETIRWKYCEGNIDDLCLRVDNKTTIAGQWNWSQAGGNCTVGIWIPATVGADLAVPDYTRCKEGIFNPMVRECVSLPIAGGNKPNVGSVNLLKLPDLTQTGLPVDGGYPSYIMVAESNGPAKM